MKEINESSSFCCPINSSRFYDPTTTTRDDLDDDDDIGERKSYFYGHEIPKVLFICQKISIKNEPTNTYKKRSSLLAGCNQLDAPCVSELTSFGTRPVMVRTT